jgi:alpha-glucosidase
VSAAEELAAERQAADPDSTLSLARRLAWIRRGDPLLQIGEQRSVHAGRDVLAWVRIGSDGEQALAAINFAAEPRLLKRPAGLPEHAALEISTDPARDQAGEATELALEGLTLAPGEGVLLRFHGGEAG